MSEKFEHTKGEIRSRKLTTDKDRQYNDRKNKITIVHDFLFEYDCWVKCCAKVTNTCMSNKSITNMYSKYVHLVVLQVIVVDNGHLFHLRTNTTASGTNKTGVLWYIDKQFRCPRLKI